LKKIRVKEGHILTERNRKREIGEKRKKERRKRHIKKRNKNIKNNMFSISQKNLNFYTYIFIYIYFCYISVNFVNEFNDNQ